MEYAEVRPHLKKLLDGPADLAPDQKDKLAKAAPWLEKLDEAKTDAELTAAWLNIAYGLSVYTVKRDDSTMYQHMVAMDAITSIELVVDYCVATLDGKLSENRELAHELIQLFFKASSFHSLNGDHVKAFGWHNKNLAYITKEGLEPTLNGARYHNLLGGDIARLFQAGLIEKCPPAASKHFERALEIHRDVLKNTLEKSGDMRHVQMCLVHCIIEELTDKLIKSNSAFYHDPTSVLFMANQLTEQLKPYVADDPYRNAGVLQNEANIRMLMQDSKSGYKYSLQAVESMREVGPKAIGQLSKLLGELGRIHTMNAAQYYVQCALHKQDYSHHNQKNAKQELQQITEHPYAQLCLKLVKNFLRADMQEFFVSANTPPVAHAINPKLASLDLQNLDQQASHSMNILEYCDKDEEASTDVQHAENLDQLLGNWIEYASNRWAEHDADNYRIMLTLARVHMMLAAKCYAEAATAIITGPEKMYADVAKRELQHILNNPYVQLCKSKLGYLIKDAKVLEELFEKASREPEDEIGLTMLFSSGPAEQTTVNSTVNFSTIVDLDHAQTRSKRRSSHSLT